MSIPTAGTKLFAKSLLLESHPHTLGVPTYLKIRRNHYRKKSKPPLSTPQFNTKQTKISPRTLRKYLDKSVKIIASKKEDLPFYGAYLRSNLRKLIITQHKSNLYTMTPKTQVTYLEGMIAGTVGDSKQLQTLHVKEQVSLPVLRSIKKLRKLRDLHVTLTQDQILKCIGMFRGLTRLESFSLDVTRAIMASLSPEALPLALQFFQNLLNMETLQEVNLNLANCLPPGDYQVINTLLSYVAQSKVSAFNIALDLREQTTFDANLATSRRLLAQVDFLDFSLLRSNSECEIAKRSKKVLWLSLDRTCSLDVASILRECESLKSLALGAQSLLNMSKDFRCPKDLKDIILSSSNSGNLNSQRVSDLIQSLTNKLEDVDTLDHFELTLGQLQDENVREFVKLHELGCVKNAKSYALLLTNIKQEAYTSTFKAICQQIRTLKSVESLKLKLPLGMYPNLDHLERALNSLPKLKCLQLSTILQQNFETDESLDFDLPFHLLSQLTSFTLNLAIPLSDDSAEQLAEGLSSLEELEKVCIVGNTQVSCLDNLDFDVFNKMMMKFSRMKKLEYVDIQWQKERFDMQSYLSYAEGLNKIRKK